MKCFKQKPHDERVQAEINNIYRISYKVLLFGICFDLVLQFTDTAVNSGGASFMARPVEFAVFMAANLLFLILMIRKGIGDDNTRYAEVERFPHLHYLGIYGLVALVATAISCCLFWFNNHANGWDLMPLIMLIFGGSVFVSIIISAYGIQYLLFRLSKKRRRQIEQKMDEDAD